jgi:hypothetical protein
MMELRWTLQLHGVRTQKTAIFTLAASEAQILPKLQLSASDFNHVHAEGSDHGNMSCFITYS